MVFTKIKLCNNDLGKDFLEILIRWIYGGKQRICE